MDARKARGQTIADTLPISKMGEAWVVSSQAGKGVYVVGKDEYGNRKCQCPDFDSTGLKYKHIFAVEFKISRAVAVDGTRSQPLCPDSRRARVGDRGDVRQVKFGRTGSVIRNGIG